MKKILIFSIVIFLMQFSSAAQSFDPTWANRFQTVLDSVITVNNVQGGSAAVLFPGQGLWTGASGIASPGVPLKPFYRFFIASNTKLFIAVTIAKLQEQGVLSLDDSLDKWLPTYRFVDSTVTIRQLLSHQSGIFDWLNDGNIWGEIWADTSHFWTPQEVLETIGSPHFAPGHGFRYSNTNYLLAGMVIEAATGETWVQKLHDCIFDPLDMDSTFVAVYEPKNGPIAPMLLMGYWHYDLETSLYSACGSAGSIFSTAQEMVQWYHSLFSGEIISDSSLQEILKIEPSSLFGLGIVTDEGLNLSHPMFYHGGNISNGYVSRIVYDIKTQSVICLLTNGGWTTQLLMEPLLQVLYDYPKGQNDAGINRIISPWDNICNNTTAPAVILKNFGSDPLTSVTIHGVIDEGSPSVFLWSGIINSNDTVTVVLNNITPGEGYHLLTCYTSGPNGGAEGYLFNDTAKSNFIINGSEAITAPWSEDFENVEFPPAGWIENPLVFTQWGQTRLASYSGLSSVVKGNYLDNHIGVKYNLDIPMLDIGNISNPELSFMYAYALYPGYFLDSLQVSISNDCGASWQTLFYDGGLSLATAPDDIQPFFPESSEWCLKNIPLAGYSGKVLIRFQSICGFGNNLFIDNIHVDMTIGTEELLSNSSFIRAYPNPFSFQTRFEYSLTEPASVCLTIFTNLGKQVAIIMNEVQPAGKYSVQWNAENLPPGVYYFRLKTGNQLISKKIIKMN